MPEVTIELATKGEQDCLQEAMESISHARSWGDLEVTLQEGPDGPRLAAWHGRGSMFKDEAESAVRIVNMLLAERKAVIDRGAGRSVRVVPATRTVWHHYPREHMSPQEEQQFHRDVETVNQGMRSGQCRFESYLDERAHIIFHYHVNTNPEEEERDGDGTRHAIGRIVDAVHTGKAVRVEMPDGAVMITPRWKISEPGEVCG